MRLPFSMACALLGAALLLGACGDEAADPSPRR
jgi:hypothetical protein